ncbi:MAG: hypothetical protein R3B35_15395 [Gemmatimonadales bacterium]
MPSRTCLFVYLYRDASNYKGWGSVEVRGDASEANDAAIREVLIDGLWFDAERAGLPTLFHLAAGASGFDSELDHPLHEFVGLESPDSGPPEAEPEMSVEELVRRLKGARQ